MASTNSKTSAARAVKNKETQTEPATVTGLHIGEVLRQAREERNVTLDALADELMIRRFYLDALENGSFRDLPERVYAIGFIRSYSTYVGVEPLAAIEQFKREAYGARNVGNYQVELSMPEPMGHSVVPNKAAILTAFVILAAVVGGIFYVTQNNNRDTSSNTIPAPIEEVSQASTPEFTDSPTAPVMTETANTPVVTTAPAVSETFPAGEAPTEFVSPSAEAAPTATTRTGADIPAALPTPTSAATLPATAPTVAAPAAEVKLDNRLVIEALKTAWVEVKDPKGTILFTSILKEGQLLPLPNGMKLTVTTGNAGGLRLLVDGQAQPQALGQVNEVKRNIPLDPATLLPQR